MIDVVWDMETGDPDDFLTLLWLLGNPKVNLLGVTITPGGADQVGLVRWALEKFKRDIPVGTFHDPAWLERDDTKQHGAPKNRVSGWHHKTYGDIPKSFESERAVDVLERLLGPNTTLITGAPLKNLGALLLRESDAPLGRVFVQGGFAGEGVVPEEQQLPKFKGMVTCPTYNLNGDPKAALRVIENAHRFSDLRFISKNVCHGVYYDQNMHEQFRAALGCDHSKNKCHCECHTPGSGVVHFDACCYPCDACGTGYQRKPRTDRVLSLYLIYRGMSAYLGNKAEGKKFHDPLAAACAVNPEIGTWADVMLYRQKGEWGSFLSEGTGIKIITAHNHDLFVRELTFQET